MVVGSDVIATDLLPPTITLRELKTGELLIKQDASDNDVFLILSGKFRVLVNDRQVATRGEGQHVGEMVAINPAMTRTATVIAVEPSVVGMLPENKFAELLKKYPAMWQPIALELSRRLDQRKQFHKTPNKTPIVFIGSSSESLRIAKALASGFNSAAASATLWSAGVFGASKFPIEDLAAQVEIADFAILVCSGEDRIFSRWRLSRVPRDNVVFELGLFMGALTRHRTFLLVPAGIKVKLPTDLLGINTIRYDTSAKTPEMAVAGAVKELIGLVQKMGPR
jgi:CRP/FNR family cyclic AMP-dependent transcriptional regulator